MSNASFLSDYEAQTQENPIGPGGERYWLIGGTIVLTDLSEFDGKIHFSTIRSPKKGEGHASAILQKITALADKHQVEITLGPKPFGDGGLSKPQLKKWYARHGWKTRKGYGDDMIRLPKGEDRIVLKPGGKFKGNESLDEWDVSGVSVPRYEVDVQTASKDEAAAVVKRIKNSPRVGHVYQSGTMVTVEVTSREARSKDQAVEFVKKLLKQGPFEAMVERQFEKLPDNFGWGHSKQVYINPNDDEFRKFAIGRGFITKEGTVYFWDNNAATHEMLEKYLKTQNRVAFYVSYKPGTPGPSAGLRFNVADYTSSVVGPDAVEIIKSNKFIQAAKPDMVTEFEVGWGKETAPGAKTFKRWDGDARAWITVDTEGNPV